MIVSTRRKWTGVARWSGNLSLRAAGDAFREPATLCVSVHNKPLYCGISTNRENIPWNATVMVSVGPLRCFATMRSASP